MTDSSGNGLSTSDESETDLMEEGLEALDDDEGDPSGPVAEEPGRPG